MISKYNGSCYICGMVTKAGKDHYDIEKKRGYHSACEEESENAPPTPDQFALSAKLGYRPAADWDLLLLPHAANGDAAWWNRREAPRSDAIRSVSASEDAFPFAGGGI